MGNVVHSTYTTGTRALPDIYTHAPSGRMWYKYNIYLINIPEPVQYVMYALAVPFDLRCESGTVCACYKYYCVVIVRNGRLAREKLRRMNFVLLSCY